MMPSNSFGRLTGRALVALTLIGGIGSFAAASVAAAEARSLFEDHTRRGDLAGAETALNQLLTDAPQDQSARTLLGVTQVLAAIEGAARRQYEYGFLQNNFVLGAGIRIPLPAHPDPQPVRYEDVRRLVADLQEGLAKAERTLAAVDVKQVHFLVDFSQIGFDLDGDGLAEQEQVAAILVGGRLPPDVAQRWVIGVDGGDVLWLRGYCHALMGICDMILAHDWETCFHAVGHRVFPRAVSPYAFLTSEQPQPGDADFFLDVIAAIHLCNWEVVEPERMRSAHGRLLEMVALSRLSWKLILAETDDDHEWIPNPRQKSQLGLAVTQEMVEGWILVQDEAERILNGERLIPFWRPFRREFPRGGRGLGINLHKVFHQPRRWDLVLWVHGIGAAPFLEEGELTDINFWSEMNRTFGRNLLGFSVWFN